MMDIRVRIKHMAFKYQNEIDAIKQSNPTDKELLTLLESFFKDFKSLL